MSNLLIEPKKIDNNQHMDRLNHWTRCHDDNISLCGLDITYAIWLEENDDVDCVVCIKLDEIHCGCKCGCCDG